MRFPLLESACNYLKCAEKTILKFDLVSFFIKVSLFFQKQFSGLKSTVHKNEIEIQNFIFYRV